MNIQYNFLEAYARGWQSILSLKFGLFSPYFQALYHKIGLMQPSLEKDSVFETCLRSLGNPNISANFEHLKKYGQLYQYECGSKWKYTQIKIGKIGYGMNESKRYIKARVKLLDKSKGFSFSVFNEVFRPFASKDVIADHLNPERLSSYTLHKEAKMKVNE